MKDELDLSFSTFDVEVTFDGFRLAVLEFAFLKRCGALFCIQICREGGNWIFSMDFGWMSFFFFKHP